MFFVCFVLFETLFALGLRPLCRAQLRGARCLVLKGYQMLTQQDSTYEAQIQTLNFQKKMEHLKERDYTDNMI